MVSRRDVAEQRSSRRFPVNLRGNLCLLKLGSSCNCTITELSLNGCRVHTDRDCNGGTEARIEVSFTLRGTAFRVGGLTEWSNGKNEIGIRFGGMSERREAQLRDLLAEVEAELAAGAAKQDSERAAAAEVLGAARAQIERLDRELAVKRAEEDAARRAAQAATEQVRLLLQQIEEAQRARTAAERLCGQLEAKEGARQEALVAAQEPESSLTQTGGKALSLPILSGEKDAHERHPAAQPFLVEQKKSSPFAPSYDETSDASRSGNVGPARERERRRETRHAVDAHGKILLLDVRSTILGRILDVSMSGCRIRSADRFPVGIYRRVEVEFVLDGLPFRLPGVVQSLHDRFTVGIRFLDVSDRKQEQLRMIIGEVAEMGKEDSQAAQTSAEN